MLNAFKARLRASICLWSSPREYRETFRLITLIAFRLVARGFDAVHPERMICQWCSQHGRRLHPSCPYHGRAAREVIFG